MNWKKPRGYDKKQMLYPDRGMLKWQGFLLSDHNDQHLEQAQILHMEETDQQLLEGWRSRRPLRLHTSRGSFYGIILLFRPPWISLKSGSERFLLHRDEILDVLWDG